MTMTGSNPIEIKFKPARKVSGRSYADLFLLAFVAIGVESEERPCFAHMRRQGGRNVEGAASRMGKADAARVEM
jgi:hypothetical protein